MAQNVRHYQDVVIDFVDYFNGQIVTGKYRVPFIVNMDETNQDFDVILRKMLERIGPQMASGYGSCCPCYSCFGCYYEWCQVTSNGNFQGSATRKDLV
jgi:hypothetical protein